MAYEHRTLLGAGSLVVESVRLDDVAAEPTPAEPTSPAPAPAEKPRRRRLLWTADIATDRQLKREAHLRRRANRGRSRAGR